MEVITVPIYGSLRVIQKFKSYNRSVICGETESGDRIITKVLKKKDESSLSLEEMKEKVKLYLLSLKKNGVPVIADINWLIEGTSLWEFYQAYRTDLGSLIAQADSPAESLRIFNLILEQIITPFFQSTKGMRLDVGLDIAPRNYVTNDGQSVYYADYLPPKIRIGDHLPLEYPEPTHPEVISIGRLRHYNKRGLLLTLLTQTCKLRPELRYQFLDVLDEFLQRNQMNELSHCFSKSPSLQLRKGEKGLKANEEIIGSLTGLGIDYLWLRDVACEIAAWAATVNPHNLNGRLKTIFDLTHLQDQPVPTSNIETAKRELIRWNFDLSTEKGVGDAQQLPVR